MFGLLIAFHVVVCLVLIFIVLLQGGKGADMGAAFGGTGQAAMGRSEMTGIAKVTAVAATIFMLTSLTLAYLSSERAASSSVIDGIQLPVETHSTPMTTPSEPAEEEPEEEAPAILEQTDAPALPETEQIEAPAATEAVEANPSSESIETPAASETEASMEAAPSEEASPAEPPPVE